MTSRPWARYAASFKGTHGRVTAGAVLSVVTGLATVPIPLLVGYAFDRAIPNGRTDTLVLVGLAILGLQILNGLGALWTRHVILGVTKQVTADLRRDSIARLLAEPRSFYTSRGLSAPHDLVVHDTERVDIMSNTLLSEVGPAIVLSLGVCLVLLWVNATLLLAMMAVIPLNVIAARWLGRDMRARIASFHSSFTRFSRSVLFLIRAIDLTRVQTAEAFETRQSSERVEDLRASSTTMSWTGSLYTVIQQNLVAAAGVVVLVLGGWMAATGRTSTGRLLSFFAGLMLLRGSMHVMLSAVPRLMEGIASLRRLMPFLDGEEAEPYRGQVRIDFRGAVSLRDVSFSYGSTPVLSGVSLDLEPGVVLALVGPNGSGKSTIVNLILGFYRPDAGGLFADGHPYDALDLRQLRGSIGVVAQDALLVPGTIRDNLLYGAPETPFEDVLDACKLAGVDAFIQRLPQGYDSPVGEDGSLLSGGQRQRVALARALVGKPRLLILDEPMNHLDESDSVEFLSRLTQASHRPAILLISHRRDGLSVAHRIVRIERGHLVDTFAAATR